MNDANNYNERYSRQLALRHFGPEAQARLQGASVLVIGAGGLGVPALQYLAGMGVGRIGVMDSDVVSLSNLHRQVLYNSNEIGQLKAVVAAEKLLALNPTIRVVAIPTMLDVMNAIETIGEYDVVIDATDSFAARYLINNACVLLDKPFVYGAVQEYEGHVSVFNFTGGPTYRCLYPTPPGAAEIPDCNVAGVLGVVPGIIGCWQALEVVKIITGVGEPLSGKLLVFDFLNNTQHTVKLKRSKDSHAIEQLQESYVLPVCGSAVTDINARQLLEWALQGKAFFLLDVREANEFIAGHLHGAHNAPLGTLQHAVSTLPRGISIVVACQSGVRSRKAVQLLQAADATFELYQLTGGMDRWMEQNGAQLILS